MNKKNLWSQELYLKAARFAAEAHRGQIVPGTDLPYLLHVTSVCMEVLATISAGECGRPDLAVQCALLHDVIEDAQVQFYDIEKIFGSDVAYGVSALTKNSALQKELKMPDSIERIKLQPREIWIVKLADRITNLQPAPPHWSAEKKHQYRDEAEYILEQLGSASSLLYARLAEKIKSYG